MDNNSLLVFFKYPEAGKVKTRLAREIGAENAARLYRLFVEAVIDCSVQVCEPAGAQVLLFYTPVERVDEIKSWIGGDRGVVRPLLLPQVGSGLGERMYNALNTAYSMGAERAVIIGTDSPTLGKEALHEAFARLNDNDVVIGPSVDGGYYLIGASLPASNSHFTGIDWGNDRVFEQTIERLKEGEATYSVLPLHYDVDNFEDLGTLKHEILQMDEVKRCNLLGIYKMLVEGLNI